MVTGREGEEEMLAQGANHHYNKIYTINRVNPAFQEDGSSRPRSSLYRTSSYSSGSRSSIGGQDAGDLGMYSLPRKHKESEGRSKTTEARSRKEGEALVPTPIWPVTGNDNLQRKSVDIMKERFSQRKVPAMTRNIESWLQFEQISQPSRSNQVPETLVRSESPDCQEFVENQKPRNDFGTGSAEHDSIVTNALLAMTGEDIEYEEDEEDEYSTERQEDTEAVIKQLAEAVSKSRGVSSLSKAVAKSKKHPDRRAKLYRQVAAPIPRQHSSQPYQRFLNTPIHENSSKYKILNERGPVGEKDHMLELYAHQLGDQISSNNPYKRFGHPPPSTSSSWLLARREDDRGWEGGRWRYSGLGEDNEKKNGLLAVFCKSFCFVLLLLSFVMVIVTVSIFLSRRGGTIIQA